MQIVFTAGEDITNFNFFNLSGDVSGDTSDTSDTDDTAGSSDAPATGEVTTDSSDKYAVGETLYTVDVIAEGETVVITLTWPETEPGYGFSYTDADGVEAEPVLVEEF